MPRIEEPLHELELFFHMITQRAILLSENGRKEDAVWLPLSQIEVEGSYIVGRLVTVFGPVWLLKKHGLI